MASGTIIFQNPNPNLKFFFIEKRPYSVSPTTLSLISTSSPTPLNLAMHTASRSNCRPILKPKVFASSSAPPVITNSNPSAKSANNPTQSLLADSTQTISTVFVIATSVSKLLANTIRQFSLKIKRICIAPSPEELAAIQSLQETVCCTVGPLFFAALRDRPSGYLNTPLTVVASGMAKWLDIYSGVLMVRVLLSWFPNIPWDRQPLSAIRDLCDPYLNLFRNIIPPIFDTLDVSPLLAFAVLGTLGSILNNSRGTY